MSRVIVEKAGSQLSRLLYEREAYPREDCKTSIMEDNLNHDLKDGRSFNELDLHAHRLWLTSGWSEPYHAEAEAEAERAKHR